MFRRVVLENWQSILPVIGFVLIAGVFFFAVLKAILSGKERCDRAARLPLDDEPHHD